MAQDAGNQWPKPFVVKTGHEPQDYSLCLDFCTYSSLHHLYVSPDPPCLHYPLLCLNAVIDDSSVLNIFLYTEEEGISDQCLMKSCSWLMGLI